MREDLTYRIKIILLLIFVFSLPFENWDPLGISSFFSVTKMTGVAYAGLAFFSMSKSFDLKFTFSIVKILLALWMWTVLQSLFHYHGASLMSIFHLTFFQGIILFWLAGTDVIRNPRILPQIFTSLIAGVTLMCVLASLGIGLSMEYQDGLAGASRISFFGSNPNMVGIFCSVAFILIVYLFIHKNRFLGKKTYFLVPSVPLILSMVGLTGSRGALGIILVGILVLFITMKTTSVKKTFYLIVGAILLFFAVSTVLESEIMQQRLQATIQDEDLAGRDMIWGDALKIIAQNPFTGHGSTGYAHKMMTQFGYSNDTHNVFLYVMVTGGIVGLAIYLFVVLKACWSAWLTYKLQKESLLLVLLFLYLFSAMKSGGFINNKFMWLLLAIIFASRFSMGLARQGIK